MPRKRSHPLDYLDLPAYKILQAMKHEHKTYTDLFKVSTLSKKHFDDLLTVLIQMDLVKEVYIPTKKGRSKKFYALTEKGSEVLKRLEDVEALCLASQESIN